MQHSVDVRERTYTYRMVAVSISQVDSHHDQGQEAWYERSIPLFEIIKVA